MTETECQTDVVDYEALLERAVKKSEKYAFANDLMYQQMKENLAKYEQEKKEEAE